jgi:outer membrane protein assembly factor BamB
MVAGTARAGVALISILWASLAVGQQAAGDWTQFRGPGGRGESAERGLPVHWSASQNIVWKTELPGPGASAPIFVGDGIYLTCYTGFTADGGDLRRLTRHLVCLDRVSGKLQWKNDLPARQPEQETIRENHGYASHTPVSDGNRIYVFCGKSGVYAFDLAGKEVWHADVGDQLHGWGSAASPMLAGDLLIVNASVESQSLYAFNKESGREVWRARGIKESWNAPILVSAGGGESELVVAIMGSVLGLDPTTGNQRWTCDTDIPWYMVPGLVSDGKSVYCIGGRSGGGLAVRLGGSGNVTKSHRTWWINKGSNVPSPILHEGKLYWAHENNAVVYCADAETGDIVYEERLQRAGQIYASPLLGDGKLYYTTRDGKTFAVSVGPKFEVLAVNDLGDRSAFNATGAIADGRLFLRSDKFLYCIDER